MSRTIEKLVVLFLVLICCMVFPMAFAESELSQGSKGVEVSIVQSWLNLLGYDVDADGEFGGATYNALIQFQEENELEVTGTANSITRTTLMQCLNDIGDNYYRVTEVDESGKQLYGFANQEGEIVIPCEYDSAGHFSEGLANVKKDGKYGYINTSGELVIPCEYYGTYGFSEGLACVQEVSGEDWGFINASGELVIPYKLANASHFSEGLAGVDYHNEEDEFVHAYMDVNGEMVIPCDGMPYDFSNGMGFVYNEEGSYVVNHDGEIIIDCVWFDGDYDTVNSFVSESLFKVEKNGRYGCANTDGELVIPCEYYYGNNSNFKFSEGLAFVNKNGEKAWIDETGKVIIDCDWDDGNNFYGGLAVVKKNIRGSEKYGCINTSGELVIPFEWDGINWEGFSREYAYATKGDYKYWINKDGEIVIEAGITYDALKKQNQQESSNTSISYAQMAANCIKVLRGAAKDPSSIQIHGIKYFVEGERYVFVMDVTGTNSFGGASRQTFACYVDPKTGSATYNSILSEIDYSMYVYVGNTVNVQDALTLAN